MKRADNQIPPRHGTPRIGNKKQRQQFVENLEGQQNGDNTHAKRRDYQRHSAHCSNRQVQTRQDSSRGRIWPEHDVESRENRAEAESRRKAEEAGNKHIHD